ncbi:MAG: hypothetical protein H7Z74_17755 [Anaerolineae bacterium]|nr:hypothetical protein [Gemmatimonadaceae bacterium]
MLNQILRALRVAGSAILLAGSAACDNDRSTSAPGNDPAHSSFSEAARFAGTNRVTLELKGKRAIAISSSHFDMVLGKGKADDASQHGALFVPQDETKARGVSWQEREFSFADHRGDVHSLRIQQLGGNGPVSVIKHYRGGALTASSVRGWRAVRGGWIATGSTLDVMHAGNVVGRVYSTVRTTGLATTVRSANGIGGLLALARALQPSPLHAQRTNRCQAQLAKYGDAYSDFSMLIVQTASPPIVEDNFRQIGDAYDRYQHATSELQRCLMQPAL